MSTASIKITPYTITIPVFCEIGGDRHEVGTITFDIEGTTEVIPTKVDF